MLMTCTFGLAACPSCQLFKSFRMMFLWFHGLRVQLIGYWNGFCFSYPLVIWHRYGFRWVLNIYDNLRLTSQRTVIFNIATLNNQRMLSSCRNMFPCVCMSRRMIHRKDRGGKLGHPGRRISAAFVSSDATVSSWFRNVWFVYSLVI